MNPVIWIVFVLGSSAIRVDDTKPRTLSSCLSQVHDALLRDRGAIGWCATYPTDPRRWPIIVSSTGVTPS